jgi:pyruvate dehydrogenase E1 component alpha subunit
MECVTYRWREHVGPREDYDSGYRGRDELRPWQESDQVKRLAQMVPKDAMDRISEEVAAQIEDAFNFATASSTPDESELLRHVYASRD